MLKLKQMPSQIRSHSGISGKHFVIALSVSVAVMLAGCGRVKADSFDNPNRFRIEAGGSSIGVALVTDRDTGVQYLMNTHSGTFTVLIDKDGKPYLANGWRDYDGND